MSAPETGSLETALQRRLLVALRLLIVVLGALAAWTWRYIPNPDGISYVDVSGHYLEGNWPLSSSGYWSPIYPTLLAAARLVGGTNMTNAWVLAHAVNLILFLSSLAAAEYFIRSVRAVTPRDDPGFYETMFTWTVLVYLLFAWTSLSWITLRLLTPDLGVAVLAYLAAGLSIRIVRNDGLVYRWIALGVVLGLGYLTKTAMLPIGIAILAAVALTATRRSRLGVIVAVAVFAVICMPQMVYVSLLKGAPTIGDVGRLAHAWYTARVPAPLGDIGPGILPAFMPSPDGPKQKLRVLDPVTDDHPMVYPVDGPVPGTLPIWYDASYWYRHVHVPLALKETLTGAARNALGYVRHFFLFILAALLALITSRQRSLAKNRFRTGGVLVLPALFVLALYALSYSEPRYIAPFAVILLAGLVLPDAVDQLSSRMRRGFTFAALLLVAYSFTETIALFKGRRTNERVYAAWTASTDMLRQLGIRSGTRIGLVGNPYKAYWAQLAGLRFVSVIPAPEVAAFWEADSLRRVAVLEKMRDHGAEFVLAQVSEHFPTPAEWVPVNSDGTLLLYRPSQAANGFAQQMLPR